MSVLTESEVRRQLKGKDFREYTEFRVLKGQIVTPSAKSFLLENNINLEYVDSLDEVVQEVRKVKEEVPVKSQTKEEKNKYETVFGAELMEKPEHMTHLYGNLLVFKDHKRIALRGKLDSLESRILETQIIAHRLGSSKLTEDLEEVLKFVRGIVRCEVMNEAVEIGRASCRERV